MAGFAGFAGQTKNGGPKAAVFVCAEAAA